MAMATSAGPSSQMPPNPPPRTAASTMMDPQSEMGASRSAPANAIPAPQRHWSDMTRTIAHYERIEQIGEGTYGQVYRARCKDTNQIVALKKVFRLGGDGGLPPTVLREIRILKRLRHPNLVQMVEVVSSKGVEHLDEDDEVEEKHKPSKSDRYVDAREGYKGKLFLVLEYISHDLAGLMDIAFRFTEVQVKCVFKQLLEALQYMHDNKYVHRDIKSSNILIDHNFRVKLADFGLARCIEPPILDRIHDRGSSQELTNKVITLWYRPPELLLGATRYGAAVDIWSAGCILAELIMGKPLFPGSSEMDQLQLIFKLLGTPSPETWEGLRDLKKLRTGEVTIGEKFTPKLRDKYQSRMSAPSLNLIEKLLELDPNKRLSASRALNSRYFLSEPRCPDNPEELGSLEIEGGHFHEFQTKKKRKEAKAVAEKTRLNALEMGRSGRTAQEEYDAVYKGIMQKVAKEGVKAATVVEEKHPGFDEPPEHGDEKQRSDKTERRKSSRDREKDPDSRRERKSRESRKDDKKREGKERSRDKSRGHRRRSESESGKTEEEKRKKRRREDKERAKEESSSDRAKLTNAEQKEEPKPTSDAVQPAPADGDRPKDAGDAKKGENEPASGVENSAGPGRFSAAAPESGTFEETSNERSSRRRRGRSTSQEREHRKSSRDHERRRSREHGRERDRRRRGEYRDGDRDRGGDRRDMERDRDLERGGYREREPDFDREPDWRRNERGGRDRPPAGEYDDFGHRPFGSPRGGPPGSFRNPPPRDDMGAYGPSSGGGYRDQPGGPPPHGSYGEVQRRGRDGSPRRDRDGSPRWDREGSSRWERDGSPRRDRDRSPRRDRKRSRR